MSAVAETLAVDMVEMGEYVNGASGANSELRSQMAAACSDAR